MTLQNLTFLETVKRMPLLELPVRTSVVQLHAARVLLSPGSLLTPQQLRDAGPVTDIVAPSLLHTAGMKAAAAAHPRARLWGPSGVAKKVPELRWHGTLEATAGATAWPYLDELPFVMLAGAPRTQEIVFLHLASRTLLVTDLVFNLEDPKGLGASLLLRLAGSYRRLSVSRIFMMQVKDRSAFESSLQKISQMEFEHIAPSHGSLILNEGKSRLLAAFRERGLQA